MLWCRDTATLRRKYRCNQGREFPYFYKGLHQQLVYCGNNTKTQKPQGLVILGLGFN